LFSVAWIVLLVALALASTLVGFLIRAVVRYTPIIGRIFEETPLFLPLRVAPEPGGQDVRFPTSDGLELGGTYYSARTDRRAGVIVFCHEFLSDRWSFLPYVGDLRNLGYDLFTFDFRNHGDSASDPDYQPLQWVTDHEVRDLRAALNYLKSRPDRDQAGVGLFGISRGGGTALCVASKQAEVWGVVTDGAFPTRGTMWSYMNRWAEIYIDGRTLLGHMPAWAFAGVLSLVGWTGRIRSQRRLRCRFPDMERAVARISPRPWLMIHGEKDAYIGPEIARRLFAEAGQPKDFWLVPGAKHNRCREVDPEGYRERVAAFVRQYGPRRPLPATVVDEPRSSPAVADRAAYSTPLASPDHDAVAPVLDALTARTLVDNSPGLG
jgi:pimeloyl-ACP methyl ester carboxylesterase